ncbi:MAG: DUF3786 domain-containing protein [Desulfobacterales bacterium]|nr:DUF3786 domain-containing protein [Desulfobacterales bacterium]
MPRIDDYNQALDLGKDEVSKKSVDQVATSSGAKIQRSEDGGISLSLSFLNQEVEIAWPGLSFHSKGSQEELSIQEQILLLHYLHGACSSGRSGITGEWISFQEVPDGRFYLDAFQRRAKIPLVQAFGNSPELLVRLATESFGAVLSDQGDYSVVVKALPLVPVALILWRGDDEFPPDGNILFDRSVAGVLSAEDIAWLAGMVVYPLIGMAKKKG